MKVNKYRPHCVRSVPHTGTRFIVDLLQRHGIKIPALHFWDFMPQDLIDSHPGLKICPIRDPAKTYITWVSNDKDLTYYYTGWKLFNSLFQSDAKVCVVPIDTPQRDFALARLSERIGVKLSTDWEPVGSGPRKDVDVPDLTEIYDLPVVKHFYR